MTEKRFTFAYETNNQYCIWWAVRDGDITLWKEEVVGLLNELNDECDFLEIENEALEDGATRYAELYHKSLKEIEQLKSEIEKLSYANEDLLEEKRIWKQMSDEYTKLFDENEQLKARADYLERKIQRLDDVKKRNEEEYVEEDIGYYITKGRDLND